jgi:hypothetical protein
MIHLNQTAEPSPYIRERAKKMWTRTLAPDTFIVKPREKGKARRVVKLMHNSSGVFIECVDKITNEPCKANQFGMHCSHAEAALNRLLINVKREANRKLKTAETT